MVPVLLTVCIMSTVVAFFEFGVFRTVAQVTPLDEIVLNPSAWVNKTVVVEGRLTGSFGHVPEGAPPYDYELSSNGTTIGVFGNNTDIDYDSVSVRVYGVVRWGRRAGGLTYPSLGVYYIEAERIDVL